MSLEKIDELLSKAKAAVTEQDKPAEPPKKKDEPEKKDEPKKEPPSDEKKHPLDDAEDEMEEGLAFSRRTYEAAKAEMKSFNDFLDAFHNGDDEKAFTTPKNESDQTDPLIERVRERPPKKWMDRCLKSVEKDPDVDDPGALCGWIWHHWATPAGKKRMKRYGVATPSESEA